MSRLMNTAMAGLATLFLAGLASQPARADCQLVFQCNGGNCGFATVCPSPPVYYTPPPVYYAPPPVYREPPRWEVPRGRGPDGWGPPGHRRNWGRDWDRHDDRDWVCNRWGRDCHWGRDD